MSEPKTKPEEAAELIADGLAELLLSVAIASKSANIERSRAAILESNQKLARGIRLVLEWLKAEQ